MPSIQHEALLQLFREDPMLSVELLRVAFDLQPPLGGATIVEASLNELIPAVYQADLVVAMGGEARLIVEVQLSRDDDKSWSWPVYLTNLRARERCQVDLLVVTPSEEVAKWARRPITLDRSGSMVKPFVLGPSSAPRITDLEVARSHPALTVLLALLRAGGDEDVEVATTAIVASRGLDPDLSDFYTDLILSGAGEAAARKILEALMSNPFAGYEYQSEFARKNFQRGREAGLEEGREEGLERGKREAAAKGILAVLEERRLSVSPAQREVLLATDDLPTLKHWLRKAVSIASVDELLQITSPGEEEDL